MDILNKDREEQFWHGLDNAAKDFSRRSGSWLAERGRRAKRSRREAGPVVTFQQQRLREPEDLSE